MRRLVIPVLSVLLLLWPAACNQGSNKEATSQAAATVTEFDGAAGMLIDQLREQGDYVNSRQFPSMIQPPTVFEELGGNNHIIDLRTADAFAAGHIEGAVNVRMDAILDHFENEIIPFKYDKIILVCYSGHISAYTTHLLRLLGYGNVYSMRWGMSAWNEQFARDYWLAEVSSDYQDRLETQDIPQPQSYSQPVLLSNAASGEELLRERVSELLSEGSGGIFATPKEVFSNPDAYYIINFERKDKYESGHIPGAIRYKPQGFLGIPAEMSTVPTDRPVIVYCGTGQNSAFAVAYLRLFGYDARSLESGNNGFMYQKMLDEQSTLTWHPFTEQDIFNYSFVND